MEDLTYPREPERDDLCPFSPEMGFGQTSYSKCCLGASTSIEIHVALLDRRWYYRRFEVVSKPAVGLGASCYRDIQTAAEIGARLGSS